VCFLCFESEKEKMKKDEKKKNQKEEKNKKIDYMY